MNKKQSILVITSQVVRGCVGARSCVFTLERLGFPVWFLPTITMTWHPGHGRAERYSASNEQFAALSKQLMGHKRLNQLGAIITGYLGAPEQAAPIARLIKQAKRLNPSLVYCCDPVIGDEEELYVAENTAKALQACLLPLADIITPNRFEFNWLTDCQHKHNEAMIETASLLSHKYIAITSAFALMKNSKAILLKQKNQEQAFLVEHRAFEGAPRGTGDLFAALFTAGLLLRDQEAERVLQRATAAVVDIVGQSARQKSDELLLIEEQARLINPIAMVTKRRLGTVRAKTNRAMLTPRSKI